MRIPKDFFSVALWKDKAKVIAMVEKLGKGQSVVKYPGRDNYNITHTENENRLPKGVEIIHRT
jgi:hypothetical protein